MSEVSAASITQEQAAYIRANQDWLLRAAIMRCRDRDLAYDLLQETFIKLIRNWAKAYAGGPPYARTVLMNCVRDEYRRRRSRPPGVSEDPDTVTRLAAAAVEEPALCEEVRRAVQELPDQLREVVVRVYYEQSSLAEVARAMGLGPKTVHNYHYMAKRKLEALLSHLPAAREGAGA